MDLSGQTLQSETKGENHGAPRRVRYLVNSTSEFREILRTINEIAGKVEGIRSLETLQQSIKFNVIPLPDSTSKFIAMFDVPSDLLGDERNKKVTLLDFSKYEQAAAQVQIFQHPAVHLYTYKVDSLFDVNLALSHFEKSIVPDAVQSQIAKASSSMKLQVTPRSGENQQIDLLISAEKNLAQLH